MTSREDRADKIAEQRDARLALPFIGAVAAV